MVKEIKSETNEASKSQDFKDLRGLAHFMGLICGIALYLIWNKKYDFWPLNLWFEYLG